MAKDDNGTYRYIGGKLRRWEVKQEKLPGIDWDSYIRKTEKEKQREIKEQEKQARKAYLAELEYDKVEGKYEEKGYPKYEHDYILNYDIEHHKYEICEENNNLDKGEKGYAEDIKVIIYQNDEIIPPSPFYDRTEYDDWYNSIIKKK